ncbi:DUF2235 domain-containing protein [Pseudomonas guariconensis]|uniref:phospholipase effector Tle1 domain-containing protein n=1 Tax=Pseudomonas TaxID=286 RepID=UPI002097920C|nr:MULTISPECIES: DUF2235 domain-containing protein [Pseudomonas]MCO7516044.1 DUF2235 domain-containing protein [Pseudomonas putida]MCO7606750.1 DUF2235 domain-containing protein [Pseudomonas guariconensis]
MDLQRIASGTPHPLTLRVGVFFDGTGNNLGNGMHAGASPERGGSYANAPSNVALLYGLYPVGAVEALADRVFFKVYVEGIGTTQGAPDSALAQATGRGQTGIEARVAEALAVVAGQLRRWRAEQPQGPVAGVELDLFGFSRGAAAARHLANQLQEGSACLLAWPVTINFIGLFDTVAAIVAPWQGNFSPANDRYGGLRLGLGEGIARQVVQLVAGDERRHNFPLVRSGHDIVVPGVHSDIGGGYLERMTERVLLSKPRSNLVPARTPAERTRAYAIATRQLAAEYAGMPGPQPRVLTWEVPVERRCRQDGPEKRVYAAVYREREVLGHLSRIYLRIMRELAVRGGVPFAEVEAREAAYRLPEALLGISAKLHDFALGRSAGPGLSEEERHLLEARYIHASAHWNALKGLRNSELEVMFVDRPAEGGRVMHVNPVG